MSQSTRHLELKPADQDENSRPRRRRPVPDPAGVDPVNSIRPVWKYESSKDGEDRNLMIVMHGAGDTETPFFDLARKWQLPGTAVLSLRGFYQVPLMDFPSFSFLPISMQHYLSPDPPPQPPTQEGLKVMRQVVLPLLRNVVEYLATPEANDGDDDDAGRGGGDGETTKKEKKAGRRKGGCGWSADQIHLFGWGESGTLGLELARQIKLDANVDVEVDTAAEGQVRRLGSVVSIAGELWSTPSVGQKDLGVDTPVLYFHRPKTGTTSTSKDKKSGGGKEADAPSWLKRTFVDPQTFEAPYDPRAAAQDEQNRDRRMPQGREEWEAVMRFWSGVLVGKEMRPSGEGVYEVVR